MARCSEQHCMYMLQPPNQLYKIFHILDHISECNAQVYDRLLLNKHMSDTSRLSLNHPCKRNCSYKNNIQINQQHRLLLPKVALFPGSCVGKEKREPGTHCLHMCQVPLHGNLHTTYATLGNFCSPAERQHCRVILPVRQI